LEDHSICVAAELLREEEEAAEALNGDEMRSIERVKRKEPDEPTKAPVSLLGHTNN